MSVRVFRCISTHQSQGTFGNSACEGTEMTVEGRCFLATKTAQFKTAYSLSVDPDERKALAQAIEVCKGHSLPSVTTEPTIGTIEVESACHPDYSPCLPNLPGDAVNCSDLTNEQKPATVLVLKPVAKDLNTNHFPWSQVCQHLIACPDGPGAGQFAVVALSAAVWCPALALELLSSP